MSLSAGDAVEAYDPETGQASTRTVEHVWINHDDDLLDLTLHGDSTGQLQAIDVPTKQQDAEVAARGLRAPPTASENQRTTVSNETVHTTAKHPWLTTDRGWVQAGALQIGEQVVRLDGSTATVTAVRVVPGAATMYNLQVSQVHTFAVGTGQYIVHNCDMTTFLAKNKGSFLDDDEGKAVFRAIRRGQNNDRSLWSADGKRFDNSLNGLSRFRSVVKRPLPGRRFNYREWTVEYGAGVVRGNNARRGLSRVLLGDDGQAWFTRDHYGSSLVRRFTGYRGPSFIRLNL